MDAIAESGSKGCRVVAVDRPPFGLSQRPLQWQDTGASDSNPYSNAVSTSPFLIRSCLRPCVGWLGQHKRLSTPAGLDERQDVDSWGPGAIG